MTDTPTWTPREVKALRECQQLSQRAFAEKLGFAQSSVVGWERPGRTRPLQHETADVLSVHLGQITAQQRDRFDRELTITGGRLGAGSAARTANLATMRGGGDALLPYAPPTDVLNRVDGFLLSPARVMVLTGAAGIGKTSVIHYVAGQYTDRADFQLFSAPIWNAAPLELGAEILRYASLPQGGDALLTLEDHSTRLTRPCVVMIDGLDTHVTFTLIGRQIEQVLRQVISPHLRFLLALRTPPGVETTAHPLLHASLYNHAGAGHDGRDTLQPWTSAQARARWDATDSSTSFDALPPGVQRLVRTPLYMRLALEAPPARHGDGLTAYALLQHCVRRVLGEVNLERHQALLTDLAHHQAPDAIPAALSAATDAPAPHPQIPADMPASLLRVAGPHDVDFAHDIVREFFLSTRIADAIQAHGRTVAAVQAMNELAERAAESATARSLFELVLQRLDAVAPTVLEAIATAPAASARTVPLMITMAGDAHFATPDLLRACAHRAERDDTPTLAHALLQHPHFHRAIGTTGCRWLLAVLRRFGASEWAGIAAFIEATFTAADAYQLLDLANVANGTEATFFARHFYLFFADVTTTLDVFLAHPNWRVRAALAEALGTQSVAVDRTGRAVLDRLMRDTDYKVRAASTPVVTRLPGDHADTMLRLLLTDDNWHVRAQALSALDHRDLPPPRPELQLTALSILRTETTWAHAPAHVQAHIQRLHLLQAISDPSQEFPTAGNAHARRALITVLRETRTGHLAPSPGGLHRLLTHARDTGHWLARREADLLASGVTAEQDVQHFRGNRDRRRIQIALDLHDINDAIRVARAAAQAGTDYLEVGDPLIKQHGISAIEHIKYAAADTTIIAEMMSADWGRDQVLLAASVGADVIQLAGPASIASVRAAVEAGHRMGTPIVLDVPAHATADWVADVERAGVDGLAVTTNIDLGIGSTSALDIAAQLRAWTALPIAVSGGFTITDTTVFTSPHWDILIIGRAVVDALDPATTAAHLIDKAHLSRRTR